MTNLREARQQGKLEQFIKEHSRDPDGDADAFDLSPEHKALAQGIAKAVNAAYEQGRADAREAMRNALGLPQEE